MEKFFTVNETGEHYCKEVGKDGVWIEDTFYNQSQLTFAPFEENLIPYYYYDVESRGGRTISCGKYIRGKFIDEEKEIFLSDVRFINGYEFQKRLGPVDCPPKVEPEIKVSELNHLQHYAVRPYGADSTTEAAYWQNTPGISDSYFYYYSGMSRVDVDIEDIEYVDGFKLVDDTKKVDLERLSNQVSDIAVDLERITRDLASLSEVLYEVLQKGK